MNKPLAEKLEEITKKWEKQEREYMQLRLITYLYVLALSKLPTLKP